MILFRFFYTFIPESRVSKAFFQSERGRPTQFVSDLTSTNGQRTDEPIHRRPPAGEPSDYIQSKRRKPEQTRLFLQCRGDHADQLRSRNILSIANQISLSSSTRIAHALKNGIDEVFNVDHAPLIFRTRQWQRYASVDNPKQS